MVVDRNAFEATVDILLQATFGIEAGQPLPPARFSLLLKPGEDPAKAMDDIARGFEGKLAVTVEQPLRDDEPDLLVLTLAGRSFYDTPHLCFEAAYRLIDTFGLANAEPEILTGIFVEPDLGGPQRLEELAVATPGGCWAPPEPRVETDKQWALTAMRVKEAWDLSPPDRAQGAGIVIAQPDTGLTAHAELQDIQLKNPIDLIQGDSDPEDPLTAWFGNNGHGTATASVVFSKAPGEVLGSAPKAILMPIRAIRSVVRTSQLSVAEAINYAVDNGAHVITMSLGGVPSFFLRAAVRRAVRNNIIVMAASGNCVREVVYPARYDDCMAIAGTNIDDQPWRGTCRGPSVAISAPAENVYRARAERVDEEARFSTGQGQGTSFAVALAAGVAACWLAHHGRDVLVGKAEARGEKLQQSFTRLAAATARKVTGWNSGDFGAGIMDAAALLDADFGLVPAGPHLELAVAAGGADSVRSLVEGAAGDRPVEEIDWEIYGPEIALNIYTNAMAGGGLRNGERGVLETIAGARPEPLSASLLERLKSRPGLKAAL
ncbi:S8 family peptidase [Roseibium marinum]|uniref:Subtilase family protein n=1 Tax=Roseibium marinum TaxID=281252 RepID=A0A2S3UJJ1_9HYPH|nr:S8 family serine peptidase [Roseibium marinum]POF27884.1 subtilase family protein [Roseibium marinum]